MRILLLILSACSLSASLNIVFYLSCIGPSHLSFSSVLIDLLNKRGHNVDVVFARLNDVVTSNGTGKPRRTFDIWFEEKNFWKKMVPHLEGFFEKSTRSFSDLPNFHLITYKHCELALQDSSLRTFLAEGKYDVALSNDYDPCGNILFKNARIPTTLSVIPTPMFQMQYVFAGLPTPASIYGTPLCSDHDGSLFDKTFHLLRSAYYQFFIKPSTVAQFESLVRKYTELKNLDVQKLEQDVDVTFVNSIDVIEQPRPTSHKIKFIGGIGMTKAKPLNKDLDALLSLPSKGTVLFSFGTQVPTSHISLEIRRNFVEAFKKFPEWTFLWKYDNMTDDADLFVGAHNVHTSEWLPQTDLLQDDRVKCFISHMGLNSFVETAAAGVPVLAIPLIVDQPHNAQNAVAKGMGVIVNRDELTYENIVKALDELLNNSKYRENAARISRMIRQKPDKSSEVFVKWVEYAAANPGLHKSFNLPGADLDPFFYYSGDVIIFLLCIIVISVFVLYRLLCFLVNNISISKTRKAKKAKRH